MRVLPLLPGSVLIGMIGLLLGGSPAASANAATGSDEDRLGSVIFIHPDGASAATWTAARALYYGPDGELHWDKMPEVAVYKGHMKDSLTATSNGGATTHAYGIKVMSDAYGRTAGGGAGEDIVDANGDSRSVAMQAIRAGLPVGLVQSGIAPEPGTGCFVSRAVSRRDYQGIAADLIESGAEVLLSGGERYFLPAGASGVHGPGVRKDGRDLIAEAEAAGYTVVRTRSELLSLPPGTTRVLGLFAAGSTFNDITEEALAERGLEPFDAEDTTLAEMTEAALRVLSSGGQRFLLVVEEEGTDNFGNKNNARGVLEAAKRADDALGVARSFVGAHPGTLLMTAADGDGGGLRMRGIPVGVGKAGPNRLPAKDVNGAPMDGANGTATAPFLAAPNANGLRLPFGVVWASRDDVSGGVVVRGEGLHSERIRGTLDNTDIAKLIRLTLFGLDELDERASTSAAP